ncbi:hypothetical protein C8R42DRAFT_729737 [Lentinula raphanica]|nr:hypothetical protein C8R42DRAFT_729737 [Lentinula raphanica]
MSRPSSSVIASITNAQAVSCERCNVCPIEGKHYFVKSSKNGPSRRVCSNCYQHYVEKKDRQNSVAASAGGSMSVIHTQSTSARIQKDVNKAQRGEFEGQRIVKAVSNRKPMAPPPNIPLAVKIPFPEHLRSRIGGHTGYSSAHELYSSCHQFFHDRAMCAGNTELVTLSATMVYAKGGRFKAVGDVTAIIPHINVRVGYHDLYSVLYIYLLPLWLKYSRNVQLLQSDTVLCNDLHAAMLAKTPDIDGIRGRKAEELFVSTFEGALDAVRLKKEPSCKTSSYRASTFVPSYMDALPHTLARLPTDQANKARSLIASIVQDLVAQAKRDNSNMQDVYLILHQLTNRFTALCLDDSWSRTIAGCACIRMMTEAPEIGTKWVPKHKIDLVRALLHILKDLLAVDLPEVVRYCVSLTPPLLDLNDELLRLLHETLALADAEDAASGKMSLALESPETPLQSLETPKILKAL